MLVPKFRPFARDPTMAYVEIIHSRTEQLQRIYGAISARVSLDQKDGNRYESGKQEQLPNAESMPMRHSCHITGNAVLIRTDREYSQAANSVD